MKITKYEHSFLVVEEQGKKLVIDPGKFSESLPKIDSVAAIVITHVHFDHFDTAKLTDILANNPQASVFSVNEVKEELDKTRVVRSGDTQQAGPFKLEFFGGRHAFVHDNTPDNENIGVLINDTFYYGGDSYDAPRKPVETLAVPASGPWSKTGEVMDFISEVKPQLVFPVHDYLNSPSGNDLQDRWLSGHCQKLGASYRRLKQGESLET